jgi:NIMA (never in mitosis gene a)-related kinase
LSRVPTAVCTAVSMSSQNLPLSHVAADNVSSTLSSVSRLQLVNVKYELVSELGRGVFGQALLARNKLVSERGNAPEELCVVKRMKARVALEGCHDPTRRTFDECVVDPAALKQSLAEVQALAAVDHPYVVRFHEAWVEQRDQHLHIAMEFCPGGNLDAFLKAHYDRVDEALVCRWMAQALLALEHLHHHQRHRIIHRDIKLPNIFLSGDHRTIKIGDFGLSKLLQRSTDTTLTMAGSPTYFSPEMAAGHEYGRKTDIWSLGVALYNILELRIPFRANNLVDLFKEIRHKAPPPLRADYGGRFSDALVALMHAMLTKAPTDRPSAKELLRAAVLQPALAELRSEAATQAAVEHSRWMRLKSVLVPHPNKEAQKAYVAINLRLAASTSSTIVRRIAKHEVVLARSITNAFGEHWLHVLQPQQGYCLAALEGQPLFVDHAAPTQSADPTTSSDNLTDMRPSPQPRRIAYPKTASRIRQLSPVRSGHISPVRRLPSPVVVAQQLRSPQPPRSPRPSPARGRLSPAAISPSRVSPAQRQGRRLTYDSDSDAPEQSPPAAHRRVHREAGSAFAEPRRFASPVGGVQSPVRRGAHSPLAHASPRRRT